MAQPICAPRHVHANENGDRGASHQRPRSSFECARDTSIASKKEIPVTKERRMMLDATMTLALTLIITAVLIALCVLYRPSIPLGSSSSTAESDVPVLK